MHDDDRGALGHLLRQRSYAALWAAWMIANLCIWMADLAASWLMTSLTDSKLMVALIQTATSLPIFLFSLPGGALADRIDRRRGFLMAQVWAALVLSGVCALAWVGGLTPWLLLAAVFATSLATALRWPMFTALVPEVVTREQLPHAISMNSIALNSSRLLGPLIAGVVVVAWGGASVFALCAALSLVAAWLVAAPAGGTRVVRVRAQEDWLQALRAGPAHIRQDPCLMAGMTRGLFFFFTASALIGLLPSLSREIGGGDPRTYATLFACLGGGAVGAGFLLQGLHRRLGYQGMVTGGALAMAACVGVLAWTDRTWVAALALLAGGVAWMGVGNALNTAAQLRLPDALRARGMSVLFMSGMAAGAVGAASLGALADGIGMRPALAVLAVFSGGAVVAMGRRLAIT